MTKPPVPAALTEMVPAPPVRSVSGLPGDPVEWITVSPATEILPEVEVMLLDRFAWVAACTVTLPLPVEIVLLTWTLPLALAPPAMRVTFPAPVVRLPGVDRLPLSERKSILPEVVVLLSGVSTRLVPAQALIEVVLASLPVKAFMLSWLASWTETCEPVELTVTWPVKSLSVLKRLMAPVPPYISAVVDFTEELLPWDTPVPLRTRS